MTTRTSGAERPRSLATGSASSPENAQVIAPDRKGLRVRPGSPLVPRLRRLLVGQTQKVMPDFGYKKEDIVFISGIGCSGRLPVLHEHIRVPHDPRPCPGTATGLKAARPDLMVWVIPGDGSALSIVATA